MLLRLREQVSEQVMLEVGTKRFSPQHPVSISWKNKSRGKTKDAGNPFSPLARDHTCRVIPVISFKTFWGLEVPPVAGKTKSHDKYLKATHLKEILTPQVGAFSWKYKNKRGRGARLRTKMQRDIVGTTALCNITHKRLTFSPHITVRLVNGIEMKCLKTVYICYCIKFPTFYLFII